MDAQPTENDIETALACLLWLRNRLHNDLQAGAVIDVEMWLEDEFEQVRA